MEKEIIKKENLEENETKTNIENEEDIKIEEEIKVEEVNTKKLKIKEIKYGISVLINLGNYENIRTNIELTAETSENDNIEDSLNELRKMVKEWGREEYLQIKQKKK